MKPKRNVLLFSFSFIKLLFSPPALGVELNVLCILVRCSAIDLYVPPPSFFISFYFLR